MRRTEPNRGQFSYANVLNLFTNKHTCRLHDRQTNALRRMVRFAKKSITGGFAMTSLPLLQRILSLACDRVCLGHSEFIDPICCILDVFGSPFERIRANEEFHSKDLICDTFVVLSSVVDSPRCGLRIVLAAAKAVKLQLANKAPHTGAGQADLRPSMWQFNQEAVTRSGIIKVLLRVLRRVIHSFNMGSAVAYLGGVSFVKCGASQLPDRVAARNSEEPAFEVLTSVISVLNEIACTSENCKALGREGAPLVLIRALEIAAAHMHNETVSLAINVLWKLFETSCETLRPHDNDACSIVLHSRFELLDHYRSANCQRMVGTRRVSRTLCRLLERSIVRGFRARDKELRNNVLVATCLLAQHVQNQLYLVDSGLLSLLLLYSCAQELGLPTEANPRNFATQSEQDFEFRRLMWQEIADLCAGVDGVRTNGDQGYAHSIHHALCQAPIVDTLLLYLNTASNPSGLHWTKPQMRTLAIDACILCLDILSVPACEAKFLELRGPSRVLGFVQRLTLTDSKQNNCSGMLANGVHGTVTFSGTNTSAGIVMHNPVPRLGVDADLVVASMQLLARCATLPGCAERFCKIDAVRCFVAMLQVTVASQEERAFHIRAISAGIIADICDSRYFRVVPMKAGSISCEQRAAVGNQKLFRRAGGVEIVRQALTISSDELAMNGCRLCMALVDLVWRSIVGNRRNEAVFVSDDGVDVLLNLIERTPASMHRQILGCLSDLMMNPLARPYFRAWRSDKNLYGATVLCLRLWASEEQRLGIMRGPAGILMDLSTPLSFTSSRVGRSAHKGCAKMATTKSGRVSTARQHRVTLPSSFAPQDMRGGSKYERLREALAAARDLVYFGDQNQAGAVFIHAVEATDIRLKVWSLLSSVGWDRLHIDDDDTVTEAILIILSLAKKYHGLAAAGAWLSSKRTVGDMGICLVRQDALAVEHALEIGFDLANDTLFRQLDLVKILQRKQDQVETTFYGNIRQQQEQEIQAHLINLKMVSL